MRKLHRGSWTLAAAGIAVLALCAGTSGATPPADVQFVVLTSAPVEPGPSSGPFTATGAAVEAGLVCPAGETVDIDAKGAGFQSGRGVSILVVKRFTCDDGSGWFDVKLEVRIDRRGDSFNWVIVDGGGAYERLRGTGQGVGTYPTAPPPDVVDEYTGQVHSD